MKKHFFLASVFIVVVVVSVFGQQTEAERAKQEQDRLAQQRSIDDQKARMNSDINEQLQSFEKWNQEMYARHRVIYSDKKLTKEEIARIKAVLAPNPQDAAKYKDFLLQPNTGLFRLFPDLGCESKNLIRADGDCADIVSGSWNYSFRLKDYSNSELFDIKLKDGILFSKSFLAQGILVRLGDVALENVSPTSDGVKFLLGFAPEDNISSARKQFNQLTTGIETADGYKYLNKIKADENITYALRVIAYRTKITTRPRSEQHTPEEFNYLNLNEGDKRIDLTVAFRIVRQEENGTITILWKEINQQDAPKLVFKKADKLSDI